MSFLRSLFGGTCQKTAAFDQTQDGKFEFLLVAVSGDTAPQIEDNLKEVCILSRKLHATILTIDSGLISMAYGFPSPPPKGVHAEILARRLTEKLADRVKIVFGTRQGRWGSIGSKNNYNLGFVISDYMACLAELCKLSFGQMREAPSESESFATELTCSFCGKLESEVDKLVAGPGVHICNNCLRFSIDIVKGDTQE